MNNLATGIYADIQHNQYHSMTDYVSNSYLSKLNKCPAAAKVPQEATAALTFGTAFHCYVLEGETVFFNQFAIAPDCDKRTKEGKALFADFQANAGDKMIISLADFILIVDMQLAVNKHGFAKQILHEGLSEQTVIWIDNDTNIKCKCRPDRIPMGNNGILVDLKTTADAGEYGFGKSVVLYGYARQAAMYLDGINAATGSNYDSFLFVAVEKTAPYRVETYLLDEEFIEYGRADYKRLLWLEKECREKGKYPNYQSNELITLYKPKYI